MSWRERTEAQIARAEEIHLAWGRPEDAELHGVLQALLDVAVAADDYRNSGWDIYRIDEIIFALDKLREVSE